MGVYDVFFCLRKGNEMGIYANMELEYELELVEQFCSHYAIMCDNMEPLVAELGSEKHYKNNIDELSHIFHNIKSASSFVELDPIHKLASVAEEVVEEAKNLKGPASDEFIEWLYLVSDQFAKYRIDLDDDHEIFSLLEPLIVKIPKDLEKKS